MWLLNNIEILELICIFEPPPPIDKAYHRDECDNPGWVTSNCKKPQVTDSGAPFFLPAACGLWHQGP